MSTDQPERFVDDEHDDERIPADAPIRQIAPDDFVARSSAQTFREALLEADRAMATSERELPRCPDCDSITIRRKRDRFDIETKIDTAYKCRVCNAPFDEPAPSIEESMPGEQTDLTSVSREVRQR